MNHLLVKESGEGGANLGLTCEAQRGCQSPFTMVLVLTIQNEGNVSHDLLEGLDGIPHILGLLAVGLASDERNGIALTEMELDQHVSYSLGARTNGLHVL